MALQLNNRRVWIIGMAKSGLSSGALCKRHGALVTYYDQADRDTLVNKGVMLPKEDQSFHGAFPMEHLKNMDLMILSPGVPTDLDFIETAKAMDIPVIGEIELAYQFSKGRLIGITGTNGKTTTTALVGAIFEASDQQAYVLGNIGTPFTQMVEAITHKDTVVLELSSYQLETVVDFKLSIGCVLNLTQDHLQRHKTMDNYGAIKMRVAKHMASKDAIVLNYDDPYLRQAAKSLKVPVIWFSRFSDTAQVHVKGNAIVAFGQPILTLSDIQIPGEHNVENVLAAIAIAYLAGLPIQGIYAGIKTFLGVPHRIERVKTVGGVTFYNDSKATNPDAAIKAIEAMTKETVLIAGGLDKKSDYSPWIACFKSVITHVVLFGETAKDIEEACKAMNYHAITHVLDLEAAVQAAYKLAQPGMHVLLSPACASWDMFNSFEERGDRFKSYVHQLNPE